jgi:transposase
MQHHLAASPELERCYRLKEEFRKIYQVRKPSKLKKRLGKWIQKLQQLGEKHLLKFVVTLKNWMQEILNAVRFKISNGAPEGLNNKIRIIIRRAYGFRNFGNLRLRTLHECGEL